MTDLCALTAAIPGHLFPAVNQEMKVEYPMVGNAVNGDTIMATNPNHLMLHQRQHLEQNQRTGGAAGGAGGAGTGAGGQAGQQQASAGQQQLVVVQVMEGNTTQVIKYEIIHDTSRQSNVDATYHTYHHQHHHHQQQQQQQHHHHTSVVTLQSGAAGGGGGVVADGSGGATGQEQHLQDVVVSTAGIVKHEKF
uniref:Uncharacterized protein n=1 Tax=Anopheles culicifacies TaxID=139723 RepID=A0A182MC10_9DIPT